MPATRKPKLKISTQIRQEFELPLTVDGSKCTIYGTYKLETRREEENLEIVVHGIQAPSGKSGLYASFSRVHIKDVFYTSQIGDGNGHDPRAQEMFKKYVHPVLVDIIPSNMRDLIRYDQPNPLLKKT
jgi:hypothetical protein